MTFYNDMSISDFLDYASESSDEMASLGGGRMIDYETGKYFDVRDEQTAVFVASARNMVEELCKRNGNQKAIIESLNATIARQQEELGIAAELLEAEKAKVARYKAALAQIEMNAPKGETPPTGRDTWALWIAGKVAASALSETGESESPK